MAENRPIWIGDITFDARDVRRLAEFWRRALHLEVQTLTDDFAAIIDPRGGAPRCCFQRGATVKQGKNRVHLDLFAADMEGEVRRLVQLGARQVRTGREGEVVWTVMQDVEGNEFCVQPPQSHEPEP